jgi:hypothetical protein
LKDLTSVRQGRDETVSAYIKRFKETKNRCFNLSITDMDLADICLKGLRSSIRDKIEGSDFLLVAQVQVRSLVVENLMNKGSITLSHVVLMFVLLIMILIVRTILIKKFMLLSSFGPLKKNLILVHLLSWIVKVGKKKLNLLLMFPSVIVY